MTRSRTHPDCAPLDWTRLDDDQLCDALSTFEERLPLAAAQECLRRLDRLAPRLVQLCRDPESWKRLDCGHWSVLHAWLVLGQSGREEFGGTLFEGARHFIPMGAYRRIWDFGDSTMASFPYSFLNILGEAASDDRLSVSFLNCASAILGMSLIRPHQRLQRAESLLRVIRNPGTQNHTRGLALHYLGRFGVESVIDSVLRGPEIPDMDRSAVRIIVDQERDFEISPNPAFYFYSPSEVGHRIDSIRDHRSAMALEIRRVIDEAGQAATGDTLKRFAASLQGLHAASRTGHLLAASWLLTFERVFKRPLLGGERNHLVWLMHRLVYHRDKIEAPSGDNFWDVLERFLLFVARERSTDDAAVRTCQAFLASCRGRYGARAGF